MAVEQGRAKSMVQSKGVKTQHTLHIPGCGSVELELGTWNVQSWLHSNAYMVLTVCVSSPVLPDIL